MSKPETIERINPLKLLQRLTVVSFYSLYLNCLLDLEVYIKYHNKVNKNATFVFCFTS